MKRDAAILLDGRGASENDCSSVGGLCYWAKSFFSMRVPAEYRSAPVHVIEALALVTSVRLWVTKELSQAIVPIGCDNSAVVLAVNGGKPRDKFLAAAARILWGIFAVHGSVCHLHTCLLS